MLRLSSLPAQAASTTDSNRGAAILAALIFAALILAKVPKRNSSTCPATLIDRAAAKWNSHLGHCRWTGRRTRHQPTAIGEAIARGVGLMRADAAGAMGIGPRRRYQ